MMNGERAADGASEPGRTTTPVRYTVLAVAQKFVVDDVAKKLPAVQVLAAV